MKTKEEIVNILLKELTCIYCYNCAFGNGDYSRCEECHRKYMNWELSKEYAEVIAEQILKD